MSDSEERTVKVNRTIDITGMTLRDTIFEFEPGGKFLLDRRLGKETIIERCVFKGGWVITNGGPCRTSRL